MCLFIIRFKALKDGLSAGSVAPELLCSNIPSTWIMLKCQTSTNLAGVVECNGIVPSHHYFGRVLIHGTLAVSHIWDIFNHHLKKHRIIFRGFLWVSVQTFIFRMDVIESGLQFWWYFTYTVVRFFPRLIQHRIGLDHVVHYVALRNLLGAELLRGRQVLPVVVAKVIVANDGRWLLTWNKDNIADLLFVFSGLLFE